MTDKQFEILVGKLNNITDKLSTISGKMWDGIEVIITAIIVYAIIKGCG